MEWGGPFFVIAIIALSTGGWLVNNWIRAKHGYSLEDEWGGKTDRAETQEAQQLRAENSKLRTLLTKVEKRMQVLERIVTDEGYDVATQIEALRDQPRAENAGAASSLEIVRKERV